MKTKTEEQIIEKAVFVDVQGTLVLGNRLNDTLYADMERIRKRGADVVIFTMAGPRSMTEHLKKLGVNTERFPVVNKFAYRGHLFTGLIIDDIPPHLQGFKANPGVYDERGSLLHYLVKQLETDPSLTFKQALKKCRTPVSQQNGR